MPTCFNAGMPYLWKLGGGERGRYILKSIIIIVVYCLLVLWIVHSRNNNNFVRCLKVIQLFNMYKALYTIYKLLESNMFTLK